MRYRALGLSGCSVSVLALGAMNFGDSADEAASLAQLDRFAEAGGTLVDTADTYGFGASESIIGKWWSTRPVEVTRTMVLATKGRFPAGEDRTGPNSLGNSRRHLARALDDSLARLGVDSVDLYQVHAWDPLTPIDETLCFLEDAVAVGKIRYYGVSNFTGWQVAKTAALPTRSRPVTAQVQYNLLAREVEWEILPACLDAGVGLLPWSPLAGGVLTGRYRRGEPAVVGRVSGTALSAWYEPRLAHDRTWAVLEAAKRAATSHGASIAQVAVAWLLARPAVSSVVLGTRTVEQLDDNLAAVELDLSVDELAELDVASRIEVEYPYHVRDQEIRSRNYDGSYPSLH